MAAHPNSNGDSGYSSAEGEALAFIPNAPLVMFATNDELGRELVCLLKGDVGVLSLDRAVERDTRIVVAVCVPGVVEPGELVFQVKVRGVMMRDGEFGCRATLCDDKSRLIIGRYLKQAGVNHTH